VPDPEYPKWGDKRLKWGMPGLRFDAPLPSYITNPPNLNQQPKGIHHMASNQLPDSLSGLETLGRDAVDGGAQLDTTIGVKQNTHDLVEADTNAFSDACDQYDAADTAVRVANTALRLAVSNTRGFLMAGRDLLKPVLGSKPSTAWAEWGFSDRSIAVPNGDDLLQPMLDKLQKKLAATPARENAPANFTAARALALYTALKNARSGADGVNAKEADRQAKKRTRDLTEAALRRRLSGLVGELSQLLDPLSPHWVTYGFKKPGAPDSPEPVTALTATALGAGRVKLEWPAAMRAERYQIWRVTDTVTGTAELVDRTADTVYLLEAQTPGAALALKVRAVNETGEGHFSPLATVTVA
jgi:hypothetical protein